MSTAIQLAHPPAKRGKRSRTAPELSLQDARKLLALPIASSLKTIINAALKLLGLSANANRKDVERAYKAQVFAHHPDVGGSAEMIDKLRMARTVLRAEFKVRGRPRKYADAPKVGKYGIVDENNVYERAGANPLGFNTRREANEHLRKMQSDAPPVPDDGKPRKTYRVVGSPTAERKREERRLKKKRARAVAVAIANSPDKVATFAEITLTAQMLKDGRHPHDILAEVAELHKVMNLNRGAYDPNGKLFVTGGNDSTHVENMRAAHELKNGIPYDDGLRVYLVRGRKITPGIRSDGIDPVGNGPDAFEFDESADYADVLEQRLSKPDFDEMHELDMSDDNGKPFITGKADSTMLNPYADEGHDLPISEGLDQFDTDEVLVLDTDGEPIEIPARVGTLTDLGVYTPENDTGLPPALDDSDDPIGEDTYHNEGEETEPVAALPKRTEPKTLSGKDVEWNPITHQLEIVEAELVATVTEPKPECLEKMSQKGKLSKVKTAVKLLT